MKQQINLYTILEPPRPTPKALIGISVASIATVVCYVIAASYFFYSSHENQKLVADAEQQSQLLKRKINQRQVNDEAIDIRSLEQQLVNLTQQQQQLDLLISSLQDPAFNNMSGFSEAMTGLARQHVQGVTIQKFSLTHRGRQFSMAGQVHSPTALPIYISKLGTETPFSSMAFERVNILEAEGELEFKITTLSEAGEGS